MTISLDPQDIQYLAEHRKCVITTFPLFATSVTGSENAPYQDACIIDYQCATQYEALSTLRELRVCLKNLSPYIGAKKQFEC